MAKKISNERKSDCNNELTKVYIVINKMAKKIVINVKVNVITN